MDIKPYPTMSLLQKLKSGFLLFSDVWNCIKLLWKVRPKLVITFGSYVSVAPLIAARLLFINTIAHEQNAVIGRANRLACLLAKKVALTFPDTEGVSIEMIKKTVVTGMPIRQDFFDIISDPPKTQNTNMKILVMGGSLGAKTLGDLVPAAIELLDVSDLSRIQIVQQCLSDDLEMVKKRYQDMGVVADIATFFNDVPRQMQAADLIISRSGAGSLAEISFIGRASILIPYPYATQDHQRKNATYFYENDAADVLAEDSLTPKILSDRIKHLLDNPQIITEMATNAQALNLADAGFALLGDKYSG